MDFIDRTLDYLEGNLDLFARFTVDFMPEKNKSLTIRRTPSAPSARFMDGSRDDVISFQILVKHPRQTEAIKTLQDIIDTLESLEEGTIQSVNGSFDFINCDLYTNMTLVERDERKNFIYTALFNANLFIK